MTMGILENLFGKSTINSVTEYSGNYQKEESIHLPKETSNGGDIRLYYYDVDGNECEKLIRDGEMWTTITGIRFRKDPERIMSEIYEGATVVLKPEPDNPVDPYAIAIYFRNELIGYVPKKDVPAILTCISTNGTEAKIGLIAPKFIRVVLAGTMKYINSHECLSRFRIVVEKDEDESPLFISSADDDMEGNSTKTMSEEISDEDENSEQKYAMKEITEMLPATCDTLEVVRDNIGRMMEGDAPIFMGVIQDDVPMYINPIHKEVLYIKNAEMEECLRKGYTVGFTISGITNTDNLAVEIGVKLQVLLERAYYDNKIAELEEEMAGLEEEIKVIEKAKDILEEGIEKTTDGHIHHEEQFEIEGDDEFDEDEMAEWESHSLRMPFTYESEKQFKDILHYLLAGKFMCFKGNKELGEGVYYCKKYDAYLRFRDSLIDAHIRNGNKAAFFIRNLDMSDRPKDIDLTIALNLY